MDKGFAVRPAYGERTERLLSLLTPCERLADVGCDHGHFAKGALSFGLCREAILTDISAKCLRKAEVLLAEEIKKGVARCVCTDGLTGVDEKIDAVVIAGMGGAEIVKILSESVKRVSPQTILLQPMKNASACRAFLTANGYRITVDEVFWQGKKYYDILVATPGTEEPYSADELEFGRQNLKEKGQAFIKRVNREADELSAALLSPTVSAESAEALNERLTRLRRALGETV